MARSLPPLAVLVPEKRASIKYVLLRKIPDTVEEEIGLGAQDFRLGRKHHFVIVEFEPLSTISTMKQKTWGTQA
jgi:hypothetical protein